MADTSLTLDDWRATVPALLAECATAWGLTPGEPYAGGWTGYAARVELPEEAGRPFEGSLVDTALTLLGELGPTQGEQVLLHQDMHALNILSAEREPWLAIDPKPLVGEREFGVAPIVRGAELRHGRREVLRRFDRLTSELGLDRERARGWTVAQTIAWGVDVPQHLEVARWLLEAA